MPQVQADVSVLLPTYNRSHFLAECLDSILGQTRLPAQVIVIDDGSTDRTQSVLQPYMGMVEYLRKPNGGKSTAINLGMSRVRGSYVWIMDDDDVALPDALEQHLAVLEEHPEVGFTYSNYILAETRPEDGRISPSAVKPMTDIPEEERFLRMMEEPFTTSQAMLVRTSCYRAVGEFDTELVRCQDYDMILRLLRRYRSVWISAPTFYRRKHAGVRGSSADNFAATEMVRKWQFYSQLIFRRLRQELPLSEYLPKSTQETCPGTLDARRAYLQRMMIMASKQLYDEMFEDLQLALSGPDDARALSPQERTLLWSIVNQLVRDNSAYFRTVFLIQIKKLCTGVTGKEIERHLARAIGGEAIRSFNKGDYTAAFCLSTACLQLLGIIRLARMGVSEIRKRSFSSGEI
jgi:glycosyltransferase involved in cell wall biosynthesis